MVKAERTITEEEIEESVDDIDAEARKIEPNIVSIGKASGRSGYLLQEGDIVYVDTWEDFSAVVANLHDDRRDNLDNDHNSKHLTVVPTACIHKYENNDEEFLKGTHLAVVNTRNRRELAKFFFDAEKHDYIETTEDERDWHKEDEEEEDDVLECPFCGKEYEMDSYFRDHVKECMEDG